MLGGYSFKNQLSRFVPANSVTAHCLRVLGVTNVAMMSACLVLPSCQLTCYAYGRERGRALSGGAHATALTGLECWSSHPVVDPLLNVLSAAAALPGGVGPDRASSAFQVRLWCRLAAAWRPYMWHRCRLIRTGERPQGSVAVALQKAAHRE